MLGAQEGVKVHSFARLLGFRATPSKSTVTPYSCSAAILGRAGRPGAHQKGMPLNCGKGPISPQRITPFKLYFYPRSPLSPMVLLQREEDGP